MSKEVRLSKLNSALGPVLALAVLTVLVAGCSKTADLMDEGTTGASSSSLSQVMDDDDVMMESSSTPAMTNDTSSSAMTASSKPSSAAHTYNNGTFAATGNYRSPAGSEAVNVTITLKDDVITNATFAGTATAPKSVAMQAKFAEGFKEAVVGKSIDELSLTVVNGSSLTPMGFMDAVAKVKAEAKA